MARGNITVTFSFEAAPFDHAIAVIEHKFYLAACALWERQWYDLTGEVWR